MSNDQIQMHSYEMNDSIFKNEQSTALYHEQMSQRVNEYTTLVSSWHAQI